MLFQCWPSVVDDGPTLKQHWVNVPCLPGTDLMSRHSLLSADALRVALQHCRVDIELKIEQREKAHVHQRHRTDTILDLDCFKTGLLYTPLTD